MKNQFTFAFIFVVLFAAIFLYSRGRDRNEWKHQVRHYQVVSDSLKSVIAGIHASVKQKDSLILLYMASLDQTLEELNKEAKKNMFVISVNAKVQDSLIAAYCRDMATLNQTPSVCK
jgi:hypothetical protein